MLRAVYDLSISSPKWDFLTALGRMEQERRKAGAEHLHILIVPGPVQGFRAERLLPTEPYRREQMLQEMCLSMTALYPRVRKVERLKSRLGLKGVLGFKERLVGLKNHLKVLRDPEGRCIRIHRPVEAGLITITLRECDYYEDRNSNLDAWVAAAEILKKRGARVVFVRDTAKADEPITGFETDPAASRDVLLRADLYARAQVNAFVPNGPYVLAQFANLPCVNFFKSGEGHRASNRTYYETCGMEWGGQWPNSPPWQYLDWRGDDDPQVIVDGIDRVHQTWSEAAE